MKKIVSLLVLIILSVGVIPAHASDQITYISTPESLAVFLNDIALAHDTLAIAGSAEVAIALPDQVFADTVIIRENGERVMSYNISRASGQTILKLQTSADTSEISLDYLVSGLRWTPTYDMWIDGEANDESVQLDFFIEIQNSAFHLDDVAVRLVAGRVDLSQQIDAISTVTANQYIAGYEATGVQPSGVVGPVTIQHVYDAGTLSAEIGDTLYVGLLSKEFPARRLLLWNAQSDIQAQVIYKVTNDAPIPLAEGVVRTYQNDLFVGSDFIEVTPIGSEGSVTVGGVQDVRVSRAESQTILQDRRDYEYLHEVTLTMSSFSDQPIDMEIIDYWIPSAQDFVFSEEPTREPGNLLRWAVTIQPGETITIEYEFKTD